MKDFEEYAAAKGFDLAALSVEGRQFLESVWRDEQNEKGKAPSPPAAAATASVAAATAVAAAGQVDLDSALRPIRDEYARQTEITKMATEYATINPSRVAEFQRIAQEAVDQTWDPLKTRLAMLETCRGSGANTVRPEEPELSDKVIEAAVCVHGGLANIEKQYDARTLEMAHKHFRGGLGLGDLIGTFARRNGYRGNSLKSNLEGNLRAAFGQGGNQYDLRAGMAGPSTYSLPNILSNVANKFLRIAFMAVDGSWRQFSAIRSVNDFKQTTTVSLTGSLLYKQIPRGGELKHGDISELAYNNQADSYGRMLGIDRRDLINDDLGALTSASTRLGRGGAMKLNDLFWSTFLNNSSFFTSGNANVSTGGGSALGLAGLATADQKFRVQTDPDGIPLGIMPAILLVPPTLRVTALNIMNSTIVVSTTTANAPIPSGNAFSGAFQVVSSPYMESSSYTGNSTAAWYLLANPADLAVIEVAFLNGQQTPTVETTEADWNTLGIAMRGYFDFGVALQEYRAGVRSAGS